MLFFLIDVLPIGEIQHPFGIRTYSTYLSVSVSWNLTKYQLIQTFFISIFCIGWRILSWNFARFHEILFQTDAESFSFLSWKNKKREFQQMAFAVPIFSEGSQCCFMHDLRAVRKFSSRISLEPEYLIEEN